MSFSYSPASTKLITLEASLGTIAVPEVLTLIVTAELSNRDIRYARLSTNTNRFSRRLRHKKEPLAHGVSHR